MSGLLIQDSPYQYALENAEYLSRLLKQQFTETYITTLCYARIYKNGKMLYLSSNKKWLNIYHNNQFHNDNYHTKTYIPRGRESYYYWPGLITDDVYKAAVDNNMCYGFNIQEAYDHYYEVFIFNTSHEHPEMINFYVNQLTYLKQIVQMIKTYVLDDMSIQERSLYSLNHSVMETLKALEIRQDFHEKLSRIDLNRMIVNRKARLSKREVECLYWACLGKTADEIASILSISRRTVETHFNNLKFKLDCVNKCQLIHKIYLHCPEFKELFR